MNHVYAEWQVTELAKLGRTDSARVERLLNALWAASPGLYEELARAAGVEHSPEPAESAPVQSGFALVETGGSSIARLAESRIAVWEVVRAHRSIGSMDALSAAFPSVERHELEAAIEYGLQHPQEIDLLIERYESKIEHRRAQYPYAR